MYKHWSGGVFYPPGLPSAKRLEHYARFFDTVELNISFYHLPSADNYKSWRDRVPADFTYVVKGSRYITHIKRLKDARGPLKLFFGRARHLEEKLRVALWQLPPRFKKDLPRLSAFIQELKPYGLCRHCFEFRDDSWFTQDVFAAVDRAGMALCTADGRHESLAFPQSADFVYVRRHGAHIRGKNLYGGSYPASDIANDARKTRAWMREGKDVYVFYNNDAHGWAVDNALNLKRLLGQPAPRLKDEKERAKRPLTPAWRG